MKKCDLDVSNKRFNCLSPIKRIDKHNWLCKCECGNECIINIYHLLDNHTKSCGCGKNINILNRTHNMSKTHLYQCYHSMLKRCKYDKIYINKNIKVCQEWLDSFDTFKIWALNNGYNDKLTLERKNVYDNYKPNNCCWVSKSEQPKNKTTTIYLTYNGITKSLLEWSKDMGISRQTLYMRYNRGWNVEKIFDKPLKVRRKK